MTNSEIISSIVSSFEINGQNRILLNGEPADAFKTSLYSGSPSGKMFFDSLQQLIYQKFYIQPCRPEKVAAPEEAELEKNIAILSKANQGVEKFDEGWIVEEDEQGETLFAAKGNKLIKLKPGEYLNVPGYSEQKQKKQVRIYRPREYSSTIEAFYFACGNAVDDNDERNAVRFYFNCTFSGNIKWMRLLTGCLNEFSVPFMFKCLIHPFFYNRSDTAVLYCDRQYARFVFEFIDSVYREAEDCMGETAPLFVQPLKKGIGFAEQPANLQESFGTHWSKMIASGIMKAYESGISKEGWPAAVMERIAGHYGYADGQFFYRNPGSTYPYPFITNGK